ncbi:MAG: hypothetical protein HUU15_16090, partial [Candidatus Brocadiae bacterium]|nr:hypothetical protein [Candidatus Brocadiia bacterium]
GGTPAGTVEAMRATVRDAEARRDLADLRRKAAGLRLETEVTAAGVAATASLSHGLQFDLRAAERAVDAYVLAEKERFRAESAKRWRSKLMQSVPKYVVQLDKAIPLTGEQKEKIEAILAEGYGIQADAMAEAEEPGIVAYGLTDLRADCERRVRAVLTPEQLQRFEKFDKSWLPGWGKN